MSEYRLLPFQFRHVSADNVLLVNECGDFVFLDHETFDRLVRHQLSETDEKFFTLKSHLFLAQEEIETSLQKIAARYRTRKSFLRDFTTLHMMVITLRCNQRCEYCQVSCAEENAHRYDMRIEVSRRVVDMIFSAPTRSPNGFAAEQAATLGYSARDFVSAYLQALDFIMALNQNIFFPEHFATLLFSRILTPFSTGFVDLQSPAGAGISGVIYDYDGSVFPADEARMLARMGNRHFCLGNVLQNSFHDIFAGQKLKSLTMQSCVETTPPCSWCVYQTYCGTDPVRNYLESGKETRNMSGTPFCTKHKRIFDGLFDRLLHADSGTQDIIWSWITHNPALVRHHVTD